MAINTNSPPLSPGSVRSARSASSGGSGSSTSSTSRGGAIAGEGLVALARDESPNASLTSLMDISGAAVPTANASQCPSAAASAMVPRSLPFESLEALEGQGFESAWAGGAGGGGGGGAGMVGCTKVDVNAMDMDVADFVEPAAGGSFVMTAAPGMTAAEAVEAIAEAAELRGITPASVVLSRTAVSPSPSNLPSGVPPPSEDGKEAEQEVMFRHGQSPSRYRSRTTAQNGSASSIAGRTTSTTSAGVTRVGSDAVITSPVREENGREGFTYGGTAAVALRDFGDFAGW